jgi:hypothetical protein
VSNYDNHPSVRHLDDRSGSRVYTVQTVIRGEHNVRRVAPGRWTTEPAQGNPLLGVARSGLEYETPDEAINALIGDPR